MAKDVKIAGASYPDVPSVELPLSNGSGTALFVDTSGDTVTEDTLKEGETAHDALGNLITGIMTTGKKVLAGTATLSSGYTWSDLGFTPEDAVIMYTAITATNNVVCSSAVKHGSYCTQQRASSGTRAIAGTCLTLGENNVSVKTPESGVTFGNSPYFYVIWGE